MEILIGKSAGTRVASVGKATAALEQRDSLQLVLGDNLVEVFFEEGTGWVIRHGQDVASRCVDNETKLAPGATVLDAHDAVVFRSEMGLSRT